MADEAQGSADREPVVIFERCTLDPSVVYVIRDGRYASYWVRPGGRRGKHFEWDWWAALEKWPQHAGGIKLRTGRGGEMCAQLAAIELLLGE